MRAWVVALGVGLVAGFACKVSLSDDLVYSCAQDSDCAGDSYVCAIKGGAGRCCKQTGPEVCDGVDNDCNGVIDDGPAEVCNGKDDNCDSRIDEGFNLRGDLANCGHCGNACTSTQMCDAGACVLRSESDCNDGIDNDNNGRTDCADPACDQASCGAGCECRNGGKSERACNDGLDNDTDTRVDCADSDCDGVVCGDGGCVCANNGKKETDCRDGVDNDGDSNTDCRDNDCITQLCHPAPQTYRCAGNGNCTCNGGATGPEDGGTACRDGLDNDCNGFIDCADFTCDLQQCAPDGGTGCQCAGYKRTETNCNNRFDDDLDGLIDCADVQDCPASVNCTYIADGGVVVVGACGADHVCH